MISNLDKYKKEIDALIREGQWLEIGLRNEMKIAIPKSLISSFSEEHENKVKEATFKNKYQKWYNASLAAVKQLLPDRVGDFTSCYHLDIKKDKTLTNYCIEDYILGLTLTAFSKDANFGFIRRRFALQYQIVCSLADRLESSLFEIKQFVEADMFDNEVDAAETLAKRGFLRSAGAICGVVIEKHLKTVAAAHNLRVTKKMPAINDLNELLKNNSIIDVAQWRHLQYMGDLRNMCDHDKDSEPTKENLNDLISGTRKVLKTIY